MYLKEVAERLERVSQNLREHIEHETEYHRRVEDNIQKIQEEQIKLKTWKKFVVATVSFATGAVIQLISSLWKNQ